MLLLCLVRRHCCPHDLPVCDTNVGRCMKNNTMAALQVGASNALPVIPVTNPVPTGGDGATHAGACCSRGELGPSCVFRPLGRAFSLQDSVPWVEKHAASRNTHGRSWVPRVPAWAEHLAEAAEAAVEGQLGQRGGEEAEKTSVLELA